MDEWVSQLEALTMDMVDILYEADDQQLVEFVECRMAVIDKIREYDWTPAEIDKYRARIGIILSYDDMFRKRMEKLKAEASAGIDKSTVARKHMKAYDASYAADSYFIDKRSNAWE